MSVSPAAASRRMLKPKHTPCHLLGSQIIATEGLRTALPQCRMTTLLLSKRGSLTLPPEMRRKMGLDKVSNPMVLVEERDGGLFLQPAAALPVRDLPKAQLKAWIARDEADMKALQAAGKTKKK